MLYVSPGVGSILPTLHKVDQPPRGVDRLWTKVIFLFISSLVPFETISGSRSSSSPACPWSREGIPCCLLRRRALKIRCFRISKTYLSGFHNASSFFLGVSSHWPSYPGRLEPFMCNPKLKDVLPSVAARRNLTSSSVALGEGSSSNMQLVTVDIHWRFVWADHCGLTSRIFQTRSLQIFTLIEYLRECCWG